MSGDNDPMDNLAQSLTDDLDQHGGSQRQAAIEAHQQRLQDIPAVLELPCTRKVRGQLVLNALLLLVIGGLCASVGGAPYLGALLMLWGLGFIASLWLHRDAGKAVLLRLTHSTLAFPALDREVALRDITELRVRDRRTLRITLSLRDGATLPGVRNAFGPLMPKAGLKRGAPTQLHLTMAGLELDGKILEPEKLMQILYTYCGAAHAQAELHDLQSRQRHGH